jgi:type III pantothenate kinase
MMLQSLTENTALTFENAAKSDGLLATDTETAVAAGGVIAVAALVEQIQRKVAAEYGVAVDLVLTGGDAAILQKALRVQSRIEDDLVLQGLVELIKGGID